MQKFIKFNKLVIKMIDIALDYLFPMKDQQLEHLVELL